MNKILQAMLIDGHQLRDLSPHALIRLRDCGDLTSGEFAAVEGEVLRRINAPLVIARKDGSVAGIWLDGTPTSL